MAITPGNADNDVVLNIVIGQSENRKYFPVFLQYIIKKGHFRLVLFLYH